MGEGGRLDAPLPPSATLAAPRVGSVVGGGPAPGPPPRRGGGRGGGGGAGAARPGPPHDGVLLAGLLA